MKQPPKMSSTERELTRKLRGIPRDSVSVTVNANGAPSVRYAVIDPRGFRFVHTSSGHGVTLKRGWKFAPWKE